MSTGPAAKNGAPRAGAPHIPPPDPVGELTFETWPGGMGPPVILLGADCRSRVRDLLQGALAATRHPIAVLVPPSGRARFEAAVADGAWDDVDRSRVRFAFASDPNHALDEAFADCAPARMHGAQVIVADPTLSEDEATRFASAFRARHLREMGEIEAACRAFRANAPRRAIPPRSVFGVADRSTTALRFLGADMASAARHLGLRADFLELDHRRNPFRPLHRLEALLAAAPDCLLSFVASRHRAWGTIAEGIPTVSYWSSDPSRYDIERMRFSADDLVCVSDAAWCDHFARLNVLAHHLPLASGLHAAVEPERVNAEEECDTVLLVGNLPAVDDVLPRHLGAMAASIDEAARIYLDGNEPSADELGQRVAPNLLPADREAVARAIEFAATRLERLRAAVVLAEAALPLRVHGCARWESALAGTAAEGRWCGPLVDRRASAAAFRNAAAVVNCVSRNGRDGVNMRVFDVAVCGGILVSNDTHGLRNAFAIGREALAFQSVEELPELLRPILADPARRASIRRAAAARALRDHTWEARWRHVFDLLAARTGRETYAPTAVHRRAA